MNKQNKGITLVALVITIIVLIILAGVSINAVMNGGLITNAKDAKNEYEAGKNKETATIADLEVQGDFTIQTTRGYDEKEEGINKYSPYKFKNAYLTGITIGAKVEEIEKSLPEEYYICNIDGTSISNKSEQVITTGMMLKKGDTEDTAEEKGRVIIFGDSSCDGNIDGSDELAIMNLLSESKEYKNWQIVAMDVDHDGIIYYDDVQNCAYYSGNSYEIKQDEYASSKYDLTIKYDTIIRKEYVNNLPENLKSIFTWNEAESMYVIKGTTGDTLDKWTVQEGGILYNDEFYEAVEGIENFVAIGTEISGKTGKEIEVVLSTSKVLETGNYLAVRIYGVNVKLAKIVIE